MKLAHVGKATVQLRTISQLDYGFTIYSYAAGYAELFPRGKYVSLMKKIASLWNEPPEPLPEEIRKKPFDPSKYHMERFLHGIMNLGVKEFLDFVDTYEWKGDR